MTARIPVPIVCFSAVDWDYLTMREHQLLTRLAPRYPVLYVDEQSHLLSLVRSPRKVRKFWIWLRGPRRVADNVWVYTPPILPPFGRVSVWVNRFNQRILSALVRHAARAVGFDRPILWLYEPEQYLQIGRHGERLVVYDCADKHAAFVRLQRPELVQEMEGWLADRADVIFTVSEALTRAMAPHRTYQVPNGADLALFRRASDPDTPIAEDLHALARPLVGYVGTLDSRVDLRLIESAARALPEHTFVFVGLVQADVRRLRALPNVRFLGRRPYRHLPNYLKGFDVCILPFQITPLTVAGSPIKLYDYLAAGKRVIATDIPEARRFPAEVRIARSPDEFTSLLQQAGEESLPARGLAERMERESWDERARAVERILEEHLAISSSIVSRSPTR